MTVSPEQPDDRPPLSPADQELVNQGALPIGDPFADGPQDPGSPESSTQGQWQLVPGDAEIKGPYVQAAFARVDGKRLIMQAPSSERPSTGAVEPPDLQQPYGTHEGTKSPGFDSLRGASDVAGTMATYQQQLTSILQTMQNILLETISRLEVIEARFDRMR